MSFRSAAIASVIVLAFAFELSAQYRFVRSHGLDVSYQIFGEGSPILVLGGGPGDASDRYLALARGVAEKYQAILVDQRGTGKSMPDVCDSSTITIAMTIDDFEAIRLQLGLNSWTVLGFSYGGQLASLYAEFCPSSISSLILVNSSGFNDDGFAFFLDNISSRLRPSDEDLYEYWSDSSRRAENPKHALVERIRAMMPGYFYDRKKALIATQSMKDSDFNFTMGRWIESDIKKRGLDLAKRGVHFGKPVLVLAGRQDPLGESIPQMLYRSYSKSTLIFVEKSGHYSWIEQPEKVYSAIENFMMHNTSLR